jgi:uncharacterized membrane protein YkvA (DUF1232 family)
MFMSPDEKLQLRRILRLPLRRKFRLAWRMRRDRRVSQAMKLPLIVVIAYLLTPINLLPLRIPFVRRLPFIRQLDNLIMAALGIWLFVKLVPDDLLEEHLSGVEKRPRTIETTARVADQTS